MAEPVTVGLLVRIEALPGRESDVENFLQHGLTLVGQEPATVRWFAIRFGPTSFGIYDAFPDDSGRQAHLSGQVGQALADNTGVLFTQPTTRARRRHRGETTDLITRSAGPDGPGRSSGERTATGPPRRHQRRSPSVLISGHQQAQATGGTLVIAAAPELIQNLLDRTGLTQVLTVYPRVTAATKSNPSRAGQH